MAMSTSAMMGIAHQPLRSAPRTSRFTPAPARPRLTRFTTVAMAAPDFLIKKLESSERTHKELTFRLADPDVASDAKEFQKLSKALGELTGVVDMYARYKECQAEEADAREMVKDAAGDAEMEAMAKEEIAALKGEMEELEEKMTIALLPKDPLDDKNIMLEIRAGTGGDEAGIWAGDLWRMYQRYAQSKGWSATILSSNTADFGGYKEIVVRSTATASTRSSSGRLACTGCSACPRPSRRGACRRPRRRWR